jgi:hypothetical protein
LRDLSALVTAWPTVAKAGGDFAIRTESGGTWRGAVMSAFDQPTLAVRTFVV